MLELPLVLALLGAAVVFLWRVSKPLALGSVAIAACSALASPDSKAADVTDRLPLPVEDQGFATSVTCRSCHPAEHASWHHSYHRSMTQPASEQAIVGNFEDVIVEDRGRRYRLYRDSTGYWINQPDPLWERRAAEKPPSEVREEPPYVDQQIVMTTGSHHMQVYWTEKEGIYFQVPLVWHIGDQRWIPSLDSFLTPPSDSPGRGITVWNFTCTRCHAVAGQPFIDNQDEPTHSAELGIACEACHGPGEEHIRANLSPLSRYLNRLDGEPDPTIANPAQMDHKKSTEVCGQCHSFHRDRDHQRWRETGVEYRAGEELEASVGVLRFEADPTTPLLKRHLEDEPDALEGYYWGDGTMRVAGREYNGMLESPCHTEGTMSCLTCHALHGYEDRNDQLRSDTTMEQTCLSCHEQFEDATARAGHTHHAAGSPGDSCLNCHMPHTTFGLYTAMRSHRIDSPSAKVTLDTGRPNACNQCHTDKTLQWTADQMAAWYGHDPLDLPEEHKQISLTVLDALRGDAAKRGFAAWTLGWDAAMQASGTGWQGLFLGQLLADPYSAVRYVARRSLKRQPGFDGFEFDFLAPQIGRQQAASQAVQTWMRSKRPVRRGDAARQVLLNANGSIRAQEFRNLQAARDDRPVRIIE